MKLCLVLFCLCIVKLTADLLPEEQIDQIINRVHDINPDVDTSSCKQWVNDSTKNTTCSMTDGKEFECTNDARLSWFTSCLSQILISSGYQIPVYVITTAASSERRKIQQEQLRNAKFRYIRYLYEYDPGQISPDDLKTYFHSTPAFPVATANETVNCAEAYFLPSYDLEAAQARCRNQGSSFSTKEYSVGMKHLLAQRLMHSCASPSWCLSNASRPELQFALIVEEDAWITTTALQSIVEIMLKVQTLPELFFLCDSFHRSPMHQPHQWLQSPFVKSYHVLHSKSINSVLISLSAVKRLLQPGSHWIPQLRAIDHNYNYAIHTDGLITHAVFPPITCHASQRDYRKTQDECQFCCDAYYNMSTMTPLVAEVRLNT